MRSRTTALGAAAALLLGLLASPRDTEACGNAVGTIMPLTKVVSDAEKLVEEGKVKGARDHTSTLLDAEYKVGHSGLVDRALIVAALAVVRSDGELMMPSRMKRKPEQPLPEGETARVRNLKDALEVLQAVLAKDAGNPVSQSNLAEAQARLPSERSAAKAKLVELETKGVLATAWGYAALASLRAPATAGTPAKPWLQAALTAAERAPRTIDVERCTKMAVRKEVCTGEKLADAMTDVPMALPKAAGAVRSL